MERRCNKNRRIIIIQKELPKLEHSKLGKLSNLQNFLSLVNKSGDWKKEFWNYNKIECNSLKNFKFEISILIF